MTDYLRQCKVLFEEIHRDKPAIYQILLRQFQEDAFLSDQLQANFLSNTPQGVHQLGLKIRKMPSPELVVDFLTDNDLGIFRSDLSRFVRLVEKLVSQIAFSMTSLS